VSELDNSDYQDWNSIHYSNWLLFEIENNILIRQLQAQIAQKMMLLSSRANSILQLNISEEKSFVIVLIVDAALVHEKKLVRVVVLKSLSSQMFQMLLRTLDGMLERRIFHISISRSIRVDMHKTKQIQSRCEECMRTGGILLVQPEHLLFFELMGLERVLSGEPELGNVLIETQRWLEDNFRDILDESDKILSVRFELVYTMGTQRLIEFSQDRWIIIQHILELVRRFASQVLQLFPQGLELRSVCPGSFPRMRILQPSAANKLLEMVATEVCEAGLPRVPVWNLPRHVRAVLLIFLTDLNMNEADTEPLQHDVFAVSFMRRSLLLLRGLIANEILAFALQQKRWRVNYELNLSRTMLAVLYRAREISKKWAKFSFSDAIIVLICISYYYDGLLNAQLRTAFEKLLLFDHAQEKYEVWMQDASKLSLTFRQLIDINLNNSAQCSRIIFSSLRLVKDAIDFYMLRIVFSKKMKKFSHKLSFSNWNIARTKFHSITKFSKTNDSRYVLLLFIEQRDLSAQFHTNATMLDYLLRLENSFKHAMQKFETKSLDAKSLLQIVVESKSLVRVILDVRAKVLKWKNEKVVREWLSRVSKAQVVVFFDDRNDLSILSRDDIKKSLIISFFAKQINQCLIFLDETHIRETNLKLSMSYRVAMTLKSDFIKNRLVQSIIWFR